MLLIPQIRCDSHYIVIRRILLDPDVDVAVIEIAPDDVLRYGLGCELLDVVAVVNADSSAPADDGYRSEPEQRLEAVAVVVRAARHVVKVGEPAELAGALHESISALGFGTGPGDAGSSVGGCAGAPNRAPVNAKRTRAARTQL